MYEAVGAAGMGFSEEARKSTVQGWMDALGTEEANVEEELSDQVNMDIEERKKIWLGLART